MIAGNTGGQAISLTEDTFYLKITAVSGTSHGWVRVERNRAHLWEETSDRVAATVDPAFEINGGTGTVGQVYKAWRHPGTGEVLFFLRGSNSNLYPGCFVYYKYWRPLTDIASANTVLANFSVSSIQGVHTGAAGNLIEWDAYAGRWRAYTVTIVRSSPAYGYDIAQFTDPNFLDGSHHDILPQWNSTSNTTLVYGNISDAPYFYSSSPDQTGSENLYYEIVKTCFNYNYLNSPQPAGGNFYYWYNKLYGVSITGQNRLAAFGTWLNGANYYQYLQNNKQQFNPSANSTGSILIPVNNLTWTDSNGNTVSESFNYNLAWSTTPQSGGNITISYTGQIPDGPSNANGSPNLGGNITGSGLLPVRTTAGTSSITTIDPVFNLPSNVTANYSESYDFSQLTIVPYPLHNLVRFTFLSNGTVSNGPSGSLDQNIAPYFTIPIFFNDLAGRQFYSKLGSSADFVISAFSHPINTTGGNYSSWQWTTPTGGTVLLTEKCDVRQVPATASFSGTTANASGVQYHVEVSLSYKHERSGISRYRDPYWYNPGTALYKFTGTSPVLAYTPGEKVQFSLTAQTPVVTGGDGPYYQSIYNNITLGTIEAEVLDV